MCLLLEKKVFNGDTDTGDSENITGDKGKHWKIIGVVLKDSPAVRKQSYL